MLQIIKIMINFLWLHILVGLLFYYIFDRGESESYDGDKYQDYIMWDLDL